MLSKIKSSLKVLLPSLKNALPFLLVVIVVLLNVAIWWAGPWLTIDGKQPLETLAHRSLASIIFSLACVSAWGVSQWWKLHQINKKQAQEKKIDDDPILRYEERQASDLAMVMQNIKESLNQSNFLYALPWYLTLGMENAGKTSLINRSGQNFIFSSMMRSVNQKSENPHTINWWVGDNAVLIDPDGVLLSQGIIGDDKAPELKRRLWLHFVAWLEKNRSRRPLNGVVVTLDIAHMIASSASERLAYANLIRARLRELMETLSTRMPVYIVMTKLDLIAGFEAFFNHYSKEEREAVLGFTFSLNEKDPLDQWLVDFNHDYLALMTLINRSLPAALLRCDNEEARNEVFSFTRQIAGLREVLNQFFKDALGSDQFTTSALVRGIYFTSVFQIGVPENVFVDTAARRYQLPQLIRSAQRVTNSTTYFTQQLFSQIIYPESGLASDNFRVAKQKSRVMCLSAVACGICFVLLSGTWHHYYQKNALSAEAVLTKVSIYRDKYASHATNKLEDSTLASLNSIRDATLEFGFFREMPRYLSDFGLYQGHKIGPSVENTYLNLLETYFLPELIKDIIHDLSAARNEASKLEILRIFRMLTDKKGRFERIVQSYFAEKWQAKFKGDRVVQEELMEHLDYAMQHTNLQAKRAQGHELVERLLHPYDQLISSIQDQLSKIPVEERVYRNLKMLSSNSLGSPLNLATSIGPIFDMVFFVGNSDDSPVRIPKMLTKQGLESYFIPELDSVSELALVDRWVLGQSEGIDFSTQDKIELRNKIRDLYVADYVDTWRRAMNAIEFSYFPDIKSAVIAFENINGNAQPLTRLLSLITQNTALFPPLPDNDVARKELEKTPQFKIAAMIEGQFSSINAMAQSDASKPSYLDEVGQSITQLQTLIKGISDSPDVGKVALNATKDRLSLKNADPIYQLERVGENMPAPFNAIIKKMANEAWYVVKQEAIYYLGERWEKDVYAPYYEKLASRYPLNPDSNKDVSLADFEAFFSPTGTLATFYNDNLKVFVEEGVGMSAGEAKSVIRDSVLNQLKQVGEIQSSFFNRKDVMDVQFSLEPVEMSSNKRRGVITIDGQIVPYNHGPRQRVGLIWPNTLRESVISKVTLVPNQTNRSPRSIETQGPWALFRLLDKAQIVSRTETTIDYAFEVDDGQVIYRLHSESHANPFTQSLFKHFRLSKKLS